METALGIVREWVRKYGERRARMGYYDITPIIDQLRKRELRTGRIRIRYDDYREAMATVGRSVPDQEVWMYGSGRSTTWPDRRPDKRPLMPEPQAGIWGPGWADLILGNATTTTSTSNTSGQTGRVENVSGRKREIGEMEDIGDDQKEGAQRTLAESK